MLKSRNCEHLLYLVEYLINYEPIVYIASSSPERLEHTKHRHHARAIHHFYPSIPIQLLQAIGLLPELMCHLA